MNLEREAKRRRTDFGPLYIHSQSSNGPPQNPIHQHQQSSNLDGVGVSNQNGTLQMRDLYFQSGNSSTVTSANSTREQLLETLRFDQIDARQLSIKKAHAKTCRWLPETTAYKQWGGKGTSCNDNHFLWVKGKPGAGKSTLMKFLLEHVRSQTRRLKAPDIIISFFFNARGNDLEKSTDGLYRSLLLQLLEARQELQFVLDATRLDRQWDLDLLKSLFEKAVQELEDVSIVCLIDALDECEEAQIRDMVDFLTGLVNDGSRLHVCFASRHYPHITIRTGLSIILESREEHESDIANYLGTALHIGQGRLAEQVRKDLQEKASGVFMWVVLVVDILNKEYDEGGKHHLQERLQQLPGDLHTLFHSILTRDRKHQAGLLLCTQWVLFAQQPLTPKQLYFAILSGFESKYLPDCHSDNYSEEDARKYILDKSKGLAESTKSKNPTIQFIHESVKDFLLKEGGLGKVFPQLGSNILGQSHSALKQCCLTYMNMESLAELSDSSKSTATRFPFLEYANKGVLYHANLAENDAISQRDFLVKFPRLKWVKHHNVLQNHKVRQYTSTASLLYLLAEAGMPALIRTLPNRQSCFEVENERYGLPILAATAMKNHVTVQAMLELEAKRLPDFSFSGLYTQLSPSPNNLDAPSRNFTFNKKKKTFPQLVEYGSEMASMFFLSTETSEPALENEQGQTVLILAAKNGYINLMEEFLRRGANLSYKDKRKRTALYFASEEGMLAAAELLINRGADVNAKGGKHNTALQAASFRGHKEVVQMLLDKDADVNAQGGHHGNALQAALWDGHKEVVQMLLDKDADVNAQGGHYGNALQAASLQGHKEVVQMLLDKDADVNAQGGHYGNALQAASWDGHKDIVQMILEKGGISTRDVTTMTED